MPFFIQNEKSTQNQLFEWIFVVQPEQMLNFFRKILNLW